MRGIFNKIAILIGVLGVVMLTGCSSNTKSILINDYYLKVNWDNNYEELQLIFNKLDKSRFEIKEDIKSISIIDKEIEGLDKLTYTVNEAGKVSRVDLRSNSKEVSMKKESDEVFYSLDNDNMVKSQTAQINYINGKDLEEKDISYIDRYLLNAYSKINIDNVIHETRSYLESMVSDRYEYSWLQDEKVLLLSNKETGAKFTTEYASEGTEGNPALPMRKITYEDKSGKKIETNIKNRGEIDTLKIYNKNDSTGKTVLSYDEQVKFINEVN